MTDIKTMTNNKNQQNNTSSLSLVFHTNFVTSELKKANKYSIPTVSELGLESFTRISKFYVPTDSELKFRKMEIENWLPIRFNLGSS